MQEGSYGMEGSNGMCEGSHATVIDMGDGTTVSSHTMEGIPIWMAIVGVVAIIAISHLFTAPRPATARRAWRLDLLRSPRLAGLIKRPAFPLIAQSLSILALLLIVSAGLFGSQRLNIATVLTWTWWWALLIFLILGLGKAFCTICPWEGLASLLTAGSLRTRRKKLGFELPWPKIARNVYPALILFILLTWFELGYGVTKSPAMTAVMALIMMALAVGAAVIFERRGFCRHACLVGRISGLYALFSPLELRARSQDVCGSCTEKSCVRGNELAVGCPTGLYPGKLEENTYCTLCTECVRACPSDNLAINLRPPGADLFHKVRFQKDEAILAIVMLALTSFHGLTMTPIWWRLSDLMRVNLGLGPKLIFTLLMTAMTAAPILLFWMTAAAARGLTPGAGVSTGRIFTAFAYAVIPVALFYHLAHNGMHFFMEGQFLLPVLSDPFGLGWNLFGTARRGYAPLLSLRTIWCLQIAFIVIGHVYGVLVSARVAHTLFKNQGDARRSLIPLLVTMILYSCFSVWLIAQPMEMRTGM